MKGCISQSHTNNQPVVSRKYGYPNAVRTYDWHVSTRAMLPASACKSNRQSELKVVKTDDHNGLLVASQTAGSHMRYRNNVSILQQGIQSITHQWPDWEKGNHWQNIPIVTRCLRSQRLGNMVTFVDSWCRRGPMPLWRRSKFHLVAIDCDLAQTSLSHADSFVQSSHKPHEPIEVEDDSNWENIQRSNFG